MSSQNMLTRLVRICLQYLYHGLARMYDTVALLVSLGHWYDWVGCVVPFAKGPLVLELGHGTGRLLQALSQVRGVQTVGLDESAQMAQLTRCRMRSSRNGFLGLSRGLAQKLPFSSVVFDSIISTFPTEFISDRETISEIHRVLRPDGRLIVLPVAWIEGKGFSEKVAAWLFKVTRQVPPAAEQNIRKNLVEPLVGSGFQVELHRIERHTSIVLVILATRQSVLGQEGFDYTIPTQQEQSP
jgi:ubiquinone/menaquinone biosynthesis C-methylase UbiE